MSSLKVLGGVAGGTLGCLLLAAIVFTQMGQTVFAGLLTVGAIVFVVAGAAALVLRAL